MLSPSALHRNPRLRFEQVAFFGHLHSSEKQTCVHSVFYYNSYTSYYTPSDNHGAPLGFLGSFPSMFSSTTLAWGFYVEHKKKQTHQSVRQFGVPFKSPELLLLGAHLFSSPLFSFQAFLAEGKFNPQKAQNQTSWTMLDFHPDFECPWPIRNNMETTWKRLHQKSKHEPVGLPMFPSNLEGRFLVDLFKSIFPPPGVLWGVPFGSHSCLQLTLCRLVRAVDAAQIRCLAERKTHLLPNGQET